METSREALRHEIEAAERRISRANAEQDILAACARDPHFVDEVDLTQPALKEDASKEVPRGIVSLERTRFAVMVEKEAEQVDRG